MNNTQLPRSTRPEPCAACAWTYGIILSPIIKLMEHWRICRECGRKQKQSRHYGDWEDAQR